MAKRPKPENQVLREKVKCVEEIRDTIFQAWDTAGLINEYAGTMVNFQMLATSAAAVVVNIIEEAIREDEKRGKP